MKTIRILLMLLGLYASNLAYGVKLPEFYGVYAEDGDRLIELAEKAGEAPEFSPNVRFLLYHKGAALGAELEIDKRIFHRNGIFRVFSRTGHKTEEEVTSINQWKPSSSVKTKVKPVPGQSEMIYVVPQAPLANGVYGVGVGKKRFVFGVNSKAYRANLPSADCVDEVSNRAIFGIFEGSKEVACSGNSAPSSGGNAPTSAAAGTGASQTGAAVKPGKTFRDCPDCPEMVMIPAGSFDMGETGSTHRVTLKDFAIGKTEVTQGQWKAVMGNNPSKFSNCGDTCPVEQVSWDDAQVFIQKLNSKTGKQYRLPSEAEWEYACRAGGRQEYCGSDNLDSVGWYGNSGQPGGNSGQTTHPVGQKQANGYGLYDMSGNVAERIEDSCHKNYNGTPKEGTAWQGDGPERILRGGSWPNKAIVLRSASRGCSDPGTRSLVIGFRLASSDVDANAKNNTGSSAGTGTGKVSGTQQIDVDKELSKYLDRPAVSEEEEKEFGRKETDRVIKLRPSPEHLRLIISRRDVISRNPNDFQNIINLSLQILQIDPADYASFDYLANLYTGVGKPDEALVYASESLKKLVLPRTFAIITQAYLKKKDKRNALLWLEKTLQSKYPYHPSAADMNRAFPDAQGEISRIFDKYRTASGTSAASPGLAQNQPESARNPQSQSNAAAGAPQAPAYMPPGATSGKVTITGWKSVVPGGKLGEFGHGTEVSKTKKGELVLASNNNPMTHTHPGIDILAQCGSPIYPLADGEVFDVINSKDDGDYGEDGKKGLGYMSIVKHDAPINTYSLYLHMQEGPSVKPGDKVIAGKTILGKVGKTGAAWGCHTHFEVRHFGTRYLTDKGWNYPANIYGKGEQPERLAKYWEDPLAMGAR